MALNYFYSNRPSDVRTMWLDTPSIGLTTAQAVVDMNLCFDEEKVV